LRKIYYSTVRCGRCDAADGPSAGSRVSTTGRRPPTQFTVEAAGESRLNTDALPQTDWLRVVEPDDRDRLRDALDGDAVDVTYRLTVDGESAWVHERGARDDESGDIVGYLFSATIGSGRAS